MTLKEHKVLLYTRFRLKKEEWKQEEAIIHKWSMLALEAGVLFLVTILAFSKFLAL